MCHISRTLWIYSPLSSPHSLVPVVSSLTFFLVLSCLVLFAIALTQQNTLIYTFKQANPILWKKKKAVLFV